MKIIAVFLGLTIIDANLFKSDIRMTDFGFRVQPWVSSFQLASSSGIRNSVRCASLCNQQTSCQYFDFDSTTKMCRTFSDGKILRGNSSKSVVGQILVNAQLYSSYNQSCTTSQCSSNRYLICDITTNRCQCPTGLVWDSSMCIVPLSADRWNKSGITVAGQNGIANLTNSTLNWPESLTIDASNALYIADTFNHRIQKWQTNRSSGTTVFGQSNGTCDYALDSLCYPNSIIIDSIGNFYVSDSGNSRVMRFNHGSRIGTIVAGDGTLGNSTNQFGETRGVALDETSNHLYVADGINHRVLRFTLGSLIGTVVIGGNGSGLNQTQLDYPRGLHLDSTTKSLLIANSRAHNVVRWKLNASSWTLFTGRSDGVCGTSANELCFPTSVTMDLLGNIYIADEGNQRIQFFIRGQSEGTTIAGITLTAGNTAMLLHTPPNLAIDDQFNLYVIDRNNFRVQKFSYS